MAESLRRLANVQSFTTLQEKIEKWLANYHYNTCDHNVSQCCDVIQLNARIQSQLYKILASCAAEGGPYGGAAIIKSRLLPWMSNGPILDTSASLILEAARKDRQLTDIQNVYERSLQDLEHDLAETRNQADDLKAALEETQLDLEEAQRKSTSDKMFSEAEVRDLTKKLRSAEDDLIELRASSGLVDGYERRVRALEDEIAVLSGRRTALLLDPLPPYRPLPLPRTISPLSYDDVTQRVREQSLINRFDSMLNRERLDAMTTLRRYNDDQELNQRICYAVVQEAFSAAKLAFSSFKMRVRSNLAVSHIGPGTLEEAVQDYINRNVDLYDLPTLVADVTRALRRNPRLSLPLGVTYSIIQPYIREACKMAWSMSALAHPLDIAYSSDAELFDEHKYRRTFDSEFSAPLVNHHIWPCLMQEGRVVIKGEACTLRGASLSSSRGRSRSRSRPGSRSVSRSLSPRRATSPLRSRTSLRSRSPSPSRRFDSGLGVRSTSPADRTPRSFSPSRSTRLSHYGVVS